MLVILVMDWKQVPLNVPNFYKTDYHLKMYNFENIPELKYSLKQRSPTFLAPGTSFVKDNFSMDQGVGDGFGMIQAHHIYCALYFYYYYIVYIMK